MAVVPDTFRTRWRNGVARISGRQFQFVQRPITVAKIRTGRFRHHYGPWDQEASPVNAVFTGSSTSEPWQATWQDLSEWVDLPIVKTCDFEQDFGSNGISRCTLALDNVLMREMNGMAGLYHLIERGALAPWRGYSPVGRPSPLQQNEWFEKLNRNAQVMVFQGYHPDEMVPVFTGLIDKLDLTSRPDQITIHLRDFGQTGTDQRLFGWVKDKALRDPIVFADRLSADKTERKGAGADASTTRDGHPASFVVDSDRSTRWVSHNHTTGDSTEWVEVRLPRGRYESFYMDCSDYEGMEAYVGIYLRGDTRQVDNETVPTGWLYDSEVPTDGGTVPGDQGGWPYVRKIGSVSGAGREYRFGFQLECGDSTVLRIGFRKLKKVQPDVYRASCTTLKGIWRQRDVAIVKQKWILVDDAADIVRVCLRWMGFKDWYVEDTGMRIKDKVSFNRQSFLLDPIKQVIEKTGFVFYIDDPLDEDSLGLPVFRQNSALVDLANIEQVRDIDLLRGIQVAIDEEPLGYIIRVRGALSKAGQTLGGDSARRKMATYRPPWTREGRLAGVIKHTNVNRYDLKRIEDLRYAAVLVAMHQLLASATAVVEIPAYPGFTLDGHVALVDTGTGLNTRMWISSRTSRYVGGKNASWVMTLTGTLIDTPDMADLRADVHELREGVSP